MKKYTKVSDIRKILPKLKQAHGSPAGEFGQMIQIRYESANSIPSEESFGAEIAGMDLRLYTGYLDEVRLTSKPNAQMIVTMKVLERVDPKTGEYKYRSFNLNRGRIRFLKVF